MIANTTAMPADVLPGGQKKSLAEFLEQRLADVSNRGDGLLGMGLTRLKPIADKLDGIQPGLYVTAAETNVGKTALQTGIFSDLLDTNHDAAGLYFSFDDAKHVIVNRFIGIETGVPLNKLQRRLEHAVDQEKRVVAYQKYIALAHAGRFALKDISDVDTVDAMEKEIGLAVARGGKVFVVADGLQNLCGDFGTGVRESHIELANRIKTIVDRYGVPLFVTVELRKRQRNESAEKRYTLHDIMESGKYGYNASVVMILENEDVEVFNATSAMLRLTFAKNKLSEFKGGLRLDFKRHCGLIENAEALVEMPGTMADIRGWEEDLCTK